MSGSDDTVALFLRARVDAHSYRLHLSRRGFDIQPDTEDALLPERGRLATLDPAPCPGRRRRHQGVLLVIDHRDKHRRKPFLASVYLPFAAAHRTGWQRGRD